ncbi:hypothetical protein B0H13DRAFT_1870288 [Mycena leptocephala]|nr:hypothetical protein B0H13DRAFT_1870288 [Mycena leptocephala]
MALAGKAAGKDVGMFFGPSAAAGALRTLVDAFPAAGLGVSVATDGTLYQTEVFAASHSPIAASSESSAASVSSHGSHGRGSSSRAGRTRGRRCGAIGRCYCCWGYAWGWMARIPFTMRRLSYSTISLNLLVSQADVRSSCYYFVGVQGDGLFYLDPHHSLPAVPLRPFAGEQLFASSVHRPLSSQGHGHSPSHLHASSTHAHERSLSPQAAYARGGSTSPESGHGHSFARGGSLSPELVYHRGGSMSPDSASRSLRAPSRTLPVYAEHRFIPSLFYPSNFWRQDLGYQTKDNEHK